jgi:D-hydroxyproline dehydrogenase subunit gamma
MFRRLHTPSQTVTILVDGRPLPAAAHDSVAAALLAAGIDCFRTTPLSGAPRAPYCMIGNCFECLVEIDDMPDRQACLVMVAEGMRINCNRSDP